MKHVLVLCESDDCLQPSMLPLAEADAVVIAFCASPEYLDQLYLHGARLCLSLKDLNLDYRDLVARAYSLVRQFVFHCPSYRGVNVLETYETELANALFAPLLMSKVHNMLHELFGTEFSAWFLAEHDGYRAFRVVNEASIRRCKIGIIGDLLRDRQPARLIEGISKFASEARFDHNWGNALSLMIEQLDHKFAWRARLDRCRKVASGGALLFSSYINYSRALSQHTAAIGTPAQWLVSNHSALKGLPKNVDPVRLWQFLPINPEDHVPVLESIQVLRSNLPELIDEFPLRAALAENSYVSSICSAVMPFLLMQVDLLHKALDEIQPDSVWVANQWGLEGCLIQAAHSRGIHVTQVQHALMESYYSCASIYSDEMLVWDEVWKSFVPQSEQNKVRVEKIGYEPALSPSFSAYHRHDSRTVTFFSNAECGLPLWNPTVFVWESIVLLHRLALRGHKVLMRVHPRDRIARYVEAWRQLYGHLPPNVAFDKLSPLAKVLEQTDIGIVVLSTTAQNCRDSHIPVFGMGWYEFMLRDLLSQEHVNYRHSIAALMDSIESSSQTQTQTKVMC